MALKKRDLEDLFTFNTQSLSPSVARQILPATGRGGVSAARDYIQANCLIAEYNKANSSYEGNLSHISSKEDLMNGLKPATRFRLKAYTPCLAARYDELKEAEQKKFFEDPDWVFTEKQNGCRGWLIVHGGEVHLFSRNYSDVDCSLLEYWQNIDQQVSWNEGIYAIDVEIKFEPGTDISKDLETLGIATDSPLEAMVALLHTYPESAVKIQKKFREMFDKELIVFRLIAPIYFNGKNYVNRTLGEGQDVYDECVEFGRSIGLNVKSIDRCNGSRVEKEIFLTTILNNGGEGIVGHYKKGMYCTSENRSKTSFIKLKRSISSTSQGMGDHIDGYISGFKMGSNGTANEGIIGAFEFSIHVTDGAHERIHTIAVVPNISREERIMATWNNADGLYPQEWTDSKGETHWVSLNPEFDGLVGEIDGQALSSVSKRMEHPRLVMWRPERSPESCIYTQEWLNSQVTGLGIKY